MTSKMKVNRNAELIEHISKLSAKFSEWNPLSAQREENEACYMELFVTFFEIFIGY